MRLPEGIRKLALPVLLATLLLLAIAGSFWVTRLVVLRNAAMATPTPAANGAILGFPINGDLAPDFKLVDQFGDPMSLSSRRGREVVLAFIDSRCTTICPLTANILYDAKAQLGASAASRVTLLAVNANPSQTSVATVRAWSVAHGMLNQWFFLTGTPQQLESIYHLYNVYVSVDSSGQVAHDAKTFIIDAQGRERLYFETLDSNSAPDLQSEVSGLVVGMRQWLPQS